jgi:hypothetical protein
MKVNVTNRIQAYLFEDIEAGEVFYSEADPDNFLLRTDSDSWVAVDIETGVLYHADDFDHDDAHYHIVKAEVTIS